MGFRGYLVAASPQGVPLCQGLPASQAPRQSLLTLAMDNHTTYNCQKKVRGGGQYHNLCFTKEKIEAHSSQLPGRSLCRRHAHTPPGSPGVSLTGPVCLTLSIWFLHSQWFSPTSFFRGLTLGFQNLYIQTPNPGDPEELRC